MTNNDGLTANDRAQGAITILLVSRLHRRTPTLSLASYSSIFGYCALDFFAPRPPDGPPPPDHFERRGGCKGARTGQSGVLGFALAAKSPEVWEWSPQLHSCGKAAPVSGGEGGGGAPSNHKLRWILHWRAVCIPCSCWLFRKLESRTEESAFEVVWISGGRDRTEMPRSNMPWNEVGHD